MKNYDCPRDDCNESFYTKLAKEMHLAQDHDPLREAVDNYPRPPEQR